MRQEFEKLTEVDRACAIIREAYKTTEEEHKSIFDKIKELLNDPTTNQR